MDEEREDQEPLPHAAFDETEIRETKTGRPDFLLPASIVIAAVLISGTIIYAVGGGRGAAPSAQNTNTNQAAAQIMTLTPSDVILGDKNAPVTLIEYGDYQCPFCARFFSDVEPQIRSTYINTGKVKMVFRNLAFLGPESVDAAAAAECANDQNQFWAYHDALYNAKIGDVQKGGGENDGFFKVALFAKLATDLKLDLGTFVQCFDNKKYAAQVASDTKQAESMGVASTPTVYVNGQEIQGAQPFSTFQQAIDSALAK